MKKRLKDIDLYKVYSNWSQGTGVFRCFFRATNFVSLKHYPDFELTGVLPGENALNKGVYPVIDAYNPSNTLFILEMPGIQAVETAFLLQKEKGLKPILTFNGIMHPYGLIGSKDYISRLVGCGEFLENTDLKGYVFVLDQQRYAEYSEEEQRKFFNNQYELTEEDLPPLEMLKELNFERVVYIGLGELKEDIDSYLTYLIENGFPVIKEKLSKE
ncbi:MAG: hypothetical protein N3B21_01015 [Clostridia bacterium]|nr:hypothetical protein [Clostridia bacterium]